jgi:hypothetical protein
MGLKSNKDKPNTLTGSTAHLYARVIHSPAHQRSNEPHPRLRTYKIYHAASLPRLLSAAAAAQPSPNHRPIPRTPPPRRRDGAFSPTFLYRGPDTYSAGCRVLALSHVCRIE